MARSAVTIKIPVTKIEKTVSEHIIGIINSSYLKGYASVDANATSDYTTVSSELTISLDLPASCLITSMSIPLTNKISNASTDGNSFAVVVENTQYGVDADGNITGAGFIEHLNNYKAQYGDFPSVKFIIGSWLLKPTSDITNYVVFQISHPIVNCTMEEGSDMTFRPTADILVGHEIASGFTGVYQLLNETVADDDGSYIRSYADSVGVDERVSILSTGILVPQGKRMLQLRSIIRAYMVHSASNNDTNVNTILTLSLDDISVTYTASGLSGIYTDSKILQYDTYNTFEYICDLNSPLINAINSYYMKNNKVPEIQVSIQTYAEGTEAAKSGITPGDVRVSQLYFEAAYEEDIDIRCKNNGTWEKPYIVYKKNNGNWYKIDNRDSIEYMFSHLIIDKCKVRGHTEMPIPEVPATCLNRGSINGIECTFCGKTLVEPEIIPIDPNNHVNVITVAKKEPTCGEDGYESYQVCSAFVLSGQMGCGAQVTEKVVLPATGNHTFVDGVCSVCGASQT